MGQGELFEIDEAKQCSKCKLFKLPTDFFRRHNGRNGRNSYCKRCTRQLLKRRAAKLATEPPTASERTCNTCGVLKSLDQFKKIGEAKFGRAATCKACRKQIYEERKWVVASVTFKESEKTCTACRQTKPLDQFQKHAYGKWGRLSRCRECTTTQRVLAQYGLSLATYEAMRVAHNDLCAICGKPETAYGSGGNGVRKLGVDHNHATGAVRGLLCAKCNTAIGAFGESIDTLRSAIAYLERYAAE